MGKLSVAGMALLLAFGLSACGGSPVPEAGPYQQMSVDTWVEAGTRVQECAKEQGIIVSVGLDGMNSLTQEGVPEDQRDIAEDVLKECIAEHNPNFQQSMFNDTQLVNLYHRYLDRKSCLEKEGFTIAEPSSEQAFVDAYKTLDPSTWIPDVLPYLNTWAEKNKIEGDGTTVMMQLERRCPDPAKFPTLLN